MSQLSSSQLSSPEHDYPLRAERGGHAAVGPAKLRYSHEAMVDMIVENPWVSQGELAKRFGYSEAWVSTIMACDAFKRQLALRREELVDPAIMMTLQERTEAMLVTSLEKLQEKLAQPSANIPDGLLLKAVELGAKMRGEGGFAPPAAPQENRLGVLAERLVQLQTNVRRRNGNEQAEEVQVIEASARGEGGELCGQGSAGGEPLQGTVRANAGATSLAAQTDGGARVDCGRCGRAVCTCDMDF